MRLRRTFILAPVVALALALAGCGDKVHHPTWATAQDNGDYVYAGPITYQLQISRQLNPYATEDSQYLKGLPSSVTPPNANELWYGVFLWAKNYGHQSTPTSDNFTITDTEGNTYYPIQINASLNSYAWTSQMLLPLGTEPAPQATASFGPTQGSMLLFKLANSVYSNRPLTLHIHPVGGGTVANISLNL